MKYLENLALENLTKSISSRELGAGLIINGKVETYSTKKAGDDKKSAKIIEAKLDETILSTSQAAKAVAAAAIDPSHGINLPTGTELEAAVADIKSRKKILGELIQTLNASMIDYDFSELTPDSFILRSLNEAVSNINSYLAELTATNPSFLNDMWKAISDAMGGKLFTCEVYQLDDSIFVDELENGMVWSFNYFLCSKELKRVCYISCFACSRYAPRSNMHIAAGMGSVMHDNSFEMYDSEAEIDVTEGEHNGANDEEDDVHMYESTAGAEDDDDEY